MIIEICTNSVQSAIHAQKAGAQRVELCAELSIGGITPSAGTIQLTRKYLTIDVFVLIRPRGGNFCYSDIEFEAIKSDIQFCKSVGCNGVVIGVLNTDGSVNLSRMAELIKVAKPMKVTFHRAFDICKNPLEALEQLIELGVDRILTSGQQNKAIDGIDLLEQLVKQANNRIKIMAGSGINADNVLKFQKIGIREVHFSASAILEGQTCPDLSRPVPKPRGEPVETSAMIFKHQNVQLESTIYNITESNIEKIKAVQQQIIGFK